MKKDKRRRTRPRNREKKGISLSQAQECRHMWVDGVCLKCGYLQQKSCSSSEKQPK